MATATRDRGKRISELVEDEAARAEAEPDDDQDAEPDDDPETGADENEEAEEADGGESIEASLKAFEAEHRRHEDELRAIMGEDFDAFEACPTCETLGYAAVPVPVLDPDLAPCPRCNTLGYTITPSGNPLKVHRPCMVCQENGFVQRVDMPPVPAATGQPSGPRFDPYTGQPLATAGAGGAVQPDGTWAPGFVPPAQPAVSQPPFN